MDDSPSSQEMLLRLQEIAERANDIAFLAQRMMVVSDKPLSIGDNDLTTLLTLLVLSLFLGSYTIVGRTSRAANLSIVNLAAPVCTAITAGVWLIVSKGESTLGLFHTLSTAFLLAFGVVAGFAAVYRRFHLPADAPSSPAQNTAKKDTARKDTARKDTARKDTAQSAKKT